MKGRAEEKGETRREKNTVPPARSLAGSPGGRPSKPPMAMPKPKVPLPFKHLNRKLGPKRSRQDLTKPALLPWRVVLYSTAPQRQPSDANIYKDSFAEKINLQRKGKKERGVSLPGSLLKWPQQMGWTRARSRAGHLTHSSLVDGVPEHWGHFLLLPQAR